MNARTATEASPSLNDAPPTPQYYEPPRENPLVWCFDLACAIIKGLIWPVAIALLIWMFYKGGVWSDAQDAVTRYRLSGTWHVDGSFADWKFSRDGTWTEDALIDTRGSYTLLEDDRIRIKGMLGTTMEFRYSFDEGELLLRGTNGTPFGYRLTRKD